MAEVSPVPIYATADPYMGTGAVGGMMQGSRATGRRLGASPARSSTAYRRSALPIDEACGWCRRSTGVSCSAGRSTPSSLPPGSDVRFSTPTIWEEYHRHIHHRLAGGGDGAGRPHHRTAHAAGAAAPRGADDTRPRGDASNELRTDPPDGRTAHQRAGGGAGRRRPGPARRRVPAARLRVDGGQHAQESTGQLQDGKTQEALATLEADTQKVFEGLRRLSQDLHPATLRLLGLAAALRTHCAEMAKHHGVDVAFTAEAVPPGVHKDVAVCFFRIAQEALRNGIVHGGARRLSVSLAGRASSWTSSSPTMARDSTSRPCNAAAAGWAW